MQDASGLLVSQRCVIGVVCDGCSSGHRDSERPGVASSNEVGARLLATMIPPMMVQLLSRRPTLDQLLLDRLASTLRTRLKKIVAASSDGHRPARERFIFDYLMTTILVTVFTDREYVVFGKGDGIFGVNANITELEDETGHYFASALFSPSTNGRIPARRDRGNFRIHARGSVSGVKNIIIGTDGMLDIHRADGSLLSRFMDSSPSIEQVVDGIDALLQEFRRALMSAKIGEDRIKDDATFVVFRRPLGTEAQSSFG